MVGRACGNGYLSGIVFVEYRHNGVQLASKRISKASVPRNLSCGVFVFYRCSNNLNCKNVVLAYRNRKLKAGVVNTVFEKCLLRRGCKVGNDNVARNAFGDGSNVEGNSTVCGSGVGVVITVSVTCRKSDVYGAKLLNNCGIINASYNVGN